MDPWIDGNRRIPRARVFARRCDPDYARTFRSHPRRHPARQTLHAAGCGHLRDLLWLASKESQHLPMNKGARRRSRAPRHHDPPVHSCGIQDGEQIVYGGEACGYVLRFPTAARSTSPATPRLLRHGAHRASLPSRAGHPAGWRPVTMGPARPRGLHPAPAEEGHPMHFARSALTGRPIGSASTSGRCSRHRYL